MRDRQLFLIIFSILGTALGNYYMIHRDLKAEILQMDEKWERLFTLFVQEKIDK